MRDACLVCGRYVKIGRPYGHSQNDQGRTVYVREAKTNEPPKGKASKRAYVGYVTPNVKYGWKKIGAIHETCLEELREKQSTKIVKIPAERRN